MNIHTQPRVVSKIPADVVGIFIDHDRIARPEPPAAVRNVPRRDAPVKIAKPEAIRPSPREMPDVPGPESTPKMPVLPGMIEVVMRVAAARIVADPVVVLVNVGSIRMARPVVKMPALFAAVRSAA